MIKKKKSVLIFFFLALLYIYIYFTHTAFGSRRRRLPDSLWGFRKFFIFLRHHHPTKKKTLKNTRLYTNRCYMYNRFSTTTVTATPTSSAHGRRHSKLKPPLRAGRPVCGVYGSVIVAATFHRPVRRHFYFYNTHTHSVSHKSRNRHKYL